MNILKSRVFTASTLVFSLMLAGCGESSTPSESDKEVKAKQHSGQVLARVNGEEITIYELNNELSRVKVTEETREAVSRNILKSLVSRKIFEQNAKKLKLDRSPRMMMEIERSKATILAKAYMQSQMIKIPEVSRSEAESYIFDNPHMFADRAYYTFDTIILPNKYLTKERRESWEKVTNLDEIESILLQQGLEYKRMPFTAYSETLPAGVVKDMPTLKMNGDVFFILMKDQSYLNIYKSSRPAVLTGEIAFKVAERNLSNQKTKEFLVKLETEVLNSSTIEYLGGYEGLKPEIIIPTDDVEVKEEVDTKDTTPPKPETEK